MGRWSILNGRVHLFVFEDNDKNFKAFIAIHSTKEGPAIGGCRFKEYESEIHAIEDVLKLSKAMTLKNLYEASPFGMISSLFYGTIQSALFTLLAVYATSMNFTILEIYIVVKS